jgi:5-methylcytosine-specific restriction endonuclease McrA
VNPTQTVATISPKRYRIPQKLELVHAYHPDYKEIVEFNTKISIDNLKENATTKIKLLIKQKGKCGMCEETLLNETGEFEYDGSTNIHHIQERRKGGRKSSMSNLMLTHTDS